MMPLKRIAALLNSIKSAVGCYSLFGICVVLAGCGSAGSKNNGLPADSANILMDVKPGFITDAEKQRLHNRCAAWYDSALKNKGFNGAVLVAKKGNIVFEAYNGFERLNAAAPITDSSSFHIASVSKTFTAMAILQLWQQGKLQLDDEVSNYFPSFNYTGVTIRTLLNHRSGLPNYVYFMEIQGWDTKRLVHNSDVLDYLVTKKSVLANIGQPNTHFSYCNTNYALLALLIEKQSGTSYANYLQQQFFTPLGMRHTFVYDSTKAASVLPSYDWRGGLIPLNHLDLVYGDKNIYSTPNDLLLWDRALSSGKLFSDKTLAEAYAPYSNEKPGIKNYGLGWRMNIYPDGKKMIYHNGWWHGNNAAFIRLTQDSATIIVLGNKFNRNIYHAKELAPLFGSYIGGGEEENEAADNNRRAADTATAAPGLTADQQQNTAKKKMLDPRLSKRKKR
ncbi:MAG: hypothetical protein RL172_219 [Bacteroidota bacterium]